MGGWLWCVESVKIQFCKSTPPRASCSQIDRKNLRMLDFLRTCLVKTRLSTTLSNSVLKPWLHLRDQGWVTMIETGRAPAPIYIKFDQGWVKDDWKCPRDRGITEHAAGKWDLVRETHTHTHAHAHKHSHKKKEWSCGEVPSSGATATKTSKCATLTYDYGLKTSFHCPFNN